MSDRSEQALRKRLELAKKATPKGERTLWTVDGAVRGYLCIRDAFNEHLLTIEDSADMATAQHIAASHPDVVCADLEEILALRAAVERLRAENQQLCREIDWLANTLEVESPYCDECDFRDERYPDYLENVTWCAHAPDGTCDSCDQSWRKAAVMATRESPGESVNFPESDQGE